MRAVLMGVVLLAGLAIGGSAAAQSSLDGPLASPEAAAPAAPHRAKAKPKKLRHAAARPVPAVDGARAVPQPSPTAASTSAARADDPISLGMKWNGNNDSAAETRSINRNGDAVGTGAEVGMKLHF